MISDVSEVLPKILEGGHSTIAGRLAGAFRNIGRSTIADNIIETMKSAGYSIAENDPFEERAAIVFGDRELSPYVNRMRMNWVNMRDIMLEKFPAPPTSQMPIIHFLLKDIV
ncbi:hypothetical protein [Desulforhopalus sp. 52FAK]